MGITLRKSAWQHQSVHMLKTLALSGRRGEVGNSQKSGKKNPGRSRGDDPSWEGKTVGLVRPRVQPDSGAQAVTPRYPQG